MRTRDLPANLCNKMFWYTQCASNASKLTFIAVAASPATARQSANFAIYYKGCFKENITFGKVKQDRSPAQSSFRVLCSMHWMVRIKGLKSALDNYGGVMQKRWTSMMDWKVASDVGARVIGIQLQTALILCSWQFLERIFLCYMLRLSKASWNSWVSSVKESKVSFHSWWYMYCQSSFLWILQQILSVGDNFLQWGISRK